MKIIAIEGIDGSGKSVQFNLLKNELEKTGKKVKTMDFPAYDSFFGEHIGELLNGDGKVTAKDVDPMSMALWFAMDRKMQFEKGIPECDYLLFNRYVLSNAAYQSSRCDENSGITQDEFIDWVMKLEHEILKLPEPDIYFFLDITKSQAGENVGKKGFRSYVGGEKKDVYEGSDKMQDGAKAAYLKCVKRFSNVCMIECMSEGKMLKPEEIHSMITDTLRKNNII